MNMPKSRDRAEKIIVDVIQFVRVGTPVTFRPLLGITDGTHAPHQTRRGEGDQPQVELDRRPGARVAAPAQAVPFLCGPGVHAADFYPALLHGR